MKTSSVLLSAGLLVSLSACAASSEPEPGPTERVDVEVAEGQVAPKGDCNVHYANMCSHHGTASSAFTNCYLALWDAFGNSCHYGITHS